jgi:hypothetical protein
MRRSFGIVLSFDVDACAPSRDIIDLATEFA